MHVGSDRMKKANAQQLRREHEALTFRDGELDALTQRTLYDTNASNMELKFL
jgi:hypothetical protein